MESISTADLDKWGDEGLESQQARERAKSPFGRVSDPDSEQSIGEDSDNKALNQMLMNPIENPSRPSDAQMPISSNAAIDLFRSDAREVDTSSAAATWGSKSDDSDYDLIAYMRRRKKGIEGRRKFFLAKHEDKSLHVVQELLLKWTLVDEPVTFGNREQQKQQALLVNAPEDLD